MSPAQTEMFAIIDALDALDARISALLSDAEYGDVNAYAPADESLWEALDAVARDAIEAMRDAASVTA